MRLRSVRASALVIALAAACHASPRARPPLPPPDARIAAAMETWGRALESGDDAAVRATEDGGGRIAFAYLAVKAAASQVDGGAQAVEATVIGTVGLWVLMSLWPGVFGGYPDDQILLAVPAGPLGPPLVAAGIATSADATDGGFAIVPVSRDDTTRRLEAASAAHRARLRDRAAWTCRPAALAHTLLPTEPTLVRGAALSPHIFGWWLDDTDALWLVRATCADGPALFVIAGHVDRNGAPQDRILAALLAPSRLQAAR